MLSPNPASLCVTVLLGIALSTQLAAALSTNDIATFLGTNSITGASVVLPKFTLSVVTNATFALVSLNITTAPKSVGWVSVAPGTQMSDADYLVAWPTISSTGAVAWTLSHRTATGEVMPKVASSVAASSTTQFYTLVPSLSTNSTTTAYSVVTYLRPLAPGSSYPSTSAHSTLTRAKTTFCYASASVNPGTASETVSLAQHDQAHATTALDLSQVLTIVASSTNGASSSTSGSGPASTNPLVSTVAGTTTRDKWLTAHGIMGSLAFLFVMPSAILLARYFRHTTWYPYHAALQVVASFLVIATASIGFWQNTASNTHGSSGVLALILVLVQVTFGYFAHKTSVPPPSESHAPIFPTLTNKSVIRLTHISFGWVVSILGLIVVRLGMYQWGVGSDASTPLSDGVIVAYWFVLVGICLAYIGGWVREGTGREKRARKLAQGENWRSNNRNSFGLLEMK